MDSRWTVMDKYVILSQSPFARSPLLVGHGLVSKVLVPLDARGSRSCYEYFAMQLVVIVLRFLVGSLRIRSCQSYMGSVIEVTGFNLPISWKTL